MLIIRPYLKANFTEFVSINDLIVGLTFAFLDFCAFSILMSARYNFLICFNELHVSIGVQHVSMHTH